MRGEGCGARGSARNVIRAEAEYRLVLPDGAPLPATTRAIGQGANIHLMGDVHAFPRRGSVFVDARGEQRTVRVACHQDEGAVVVSLRVVGVCRASFRLPATLAPEMAELFAACAGDAAPDPRVGDPIGRRPPAQAS